MKSHIYPQAILRKILEFWLKNRIWYKKIYVINLDLESIEERVISNKQDIHKLLNWDKIFHFDINANNIKHFEKLWNQEIETKFIEKVDQSIFKKFIQSSSAWDSSFLKDVNYIFQVKKDIILDFFWLNYFRSSFLAWKKVKIEDKFGNIECIDMSDELLSIAMDLDCNNFINQWIEIRKDFFCPSYNDYEVLFFPYMFNTILVPPLYGIIESENSLKFIGIHISCGMIFLIKKGFRFFIHNIDQSLDFEVKENKIEDKNKIFYNLFILNKDVENDLEKIVFGFWKYLFKNWICSYGVITGMAISFDPIWKNKEFTNFLNKLRNKQLKNPEYFINKRILRIDKE